MKRRDLIKAALGTPALAFLPASSQAQVKGEPYRTPPGHTRNTWREPRVCPCVFIEEFDRRDPDNQYRTRLELFSRCKAHENSTVEAVEEEFLRPMAVLSEIIDALPTEEAWKAHDNFTYIYSRDRKLIVPKPEGLDSKSQARICTDCHKVEFHG